MQRAYLHGFASGPLSKKGQRLRAAFEEAGLALRLPDLNVPSFERLSLTAMLDALDALDAAEGDAEGWGLVGSSLGGWLAARWAERRPARVARLLLLCPAFDLAARWPSLLPPGAMRTWERSGALILPDGAGTPRPVHYRFYEEAREQPALPEVTCETRIVHGTRDERVPVEGSRHYAAARPHVTLVEVDDVHDLLASQDRVVEEALAWLGPGPDATD
ncbi:MAG TPA: YqiA/YcfP family alpha/beta fold hydrolase [Sandaracinaceae bacterium LLY-WYZ-13_1]|nr:YqiA/YcfP family alpha/beta fold hydrolase [Sandaracinaceae bacterium LLY-WYZ-13_1]